MALITHSISKDIMALRHKLGCSQEIFGRIIGTCGRTVARWEVDDTEPSPLAMQRIRELQVLLTKTEDVLKKGKEAAWFHTPSHDLDNKTPLETILQDSDGIQKVIRLLGQAEWGIQT